MTKLWKFLIDPKNRMVLGWIGGAIVAVASGGWTVATYIWPDAPTPPSITCAQNGSIAAGKNATGNQIQYTAGSTTQRSGSQTCGEPEHH